MSCTWYQISSYFELEHLFWTGILDSFRHLVLYRQFYAYLLIPISQYCQMTRHFMNMCITLDVYVCWDWWWASTGKKRKRMGTGKRMEGTASNWIKTNNLNWCFENSFHVRLVVFLSLLYNSLKLILSALSRKFVVHMQCKLHRSPDSFTVTHFYTFRLNIMY